ncbi:MAG: hypothetical protein AAB225_04580 [Acidobacteriota bacterium]
MFTTAARVGKRSLPWTKRHRSVRSHAFHGSCLLVVYLIGHSVVGPFFRALPGSHLRSVSQS